MSGPGTSLAAHLVAERVTGLGEPALFGSGFFPTGFAGRFSYVLAACEIRGFSGGRNTPSSGKLKGRGLSGRPRCRQ